MKDYSCSEIGMLTGTTLGGLIALLGFMKTYSVLSFLLTVFGMAAGIFIGDCLDRKKNYAYAEIKNRQGYQREDFK